ncbi:hypothetical protein [Kordiimonas sp. SCSIO 12610]|uniref:hypothetical protein n=1 Tax=Kordiimonas sp. SCSIO 12610 TaxID=2829597 RepID=UPI00210CE436|nr:hypothetical protein [Kordiimonas sp. SCSIO 12610]UTW56540.1 hypothetical protein KFF44_06475 [Kordiimonas sp. SCSIO 12610]
MFENRLLSDDASVRLLCCDVSEVSVLQEFAHYCASLYFDSDGKSLQKTAFSPTKITGVLPFIVISEIIDGDVFFRLAGTLIEPIFSSQSVTGKKVADFIPPESKDAVQEFFQFGGNNNLVSFQEEDLELASGDVITCMTLGFPFEREDGGKCFRISASYYTYRKQHSILPEGINVKHSKIHNIRFAPLDKFMDAISALPQ